MKRLAFLLAVVFMSSYVQAATYTVTPGQSIQTAIDTASYGDTVEVAAGTYPENITLKNGVTLTGESKDSTFIDPNNIGSAVTSIACDPNTVIEGFKITRGVGTMIDVWNWGPGNELECGGGMYNNYSSPTINNCIFEANSSVAYGSAMYNFNNSNPTITNCFFLNNTDAIYGGSGICNEGSAVTISDCQFDNNSTTSYGGAIYNSYNTDETIISRCTFTNNTADGGGGAIYSFYSDNRITDCTFDNNSTSGSGGAIYDYGGVTSVISGCTFTGNSAFDGGGYHGVGDSVISDCFFKDNSAAKGGAAYVGGGIVVTNCTMKANIAVGAGGGGAIYTWYDIIIANCLITGNTAGDGGAIYAFASTGEIINCSIVGNSALYDGGSIYNDDYVNEQALTFINSIVRDGTAANNGNEIYHSFSTSSKFTFVYSNLEGSGQSGAGWDADLAIDGGNNIDVDPMFIDADGPDDQYGTDDDDLHFMAGSPVIDAGTNQFAAADHGDLDSDGVAVEIGPFDLDGNMRFSDDPGVADTGISYFPSLGVVDMGPYEYPGFAYIEGDINRDGRVDMLDLAIMASNWLAGT